MDRRSAESLPSLDSVRLENICGIFSRSWRASALRVPSGRGDITNPSALLALLFSTTLAPIAGEFGILCGVLAGFLHASVALNVGIVYGGMNLYNNGFAGGIVAMFLVPVIQSIRDRRAAGEGRSVAVRFPLFNGILTRKRHRDIVSL